MMKIKGVQKVTLIDYPEKVACTLFLFGCNFKCGFCHNPELVIREDSDDLDKMEFLNFLKKRRNKLEGVCITGGEPLVSLEKDFLKKIKSLGYSIKLDTNGSFPEKLKEFIDEKLIDFVAMDIKGPKNKYLEIINSEIDLIKIEESIILICNSGVDYEFRTTIVPGIHNSESIEQIGKWIFVLNGGKVKKYALQGFRNSGKFIDEKFKEKENVGEEFLKNLKDIAKNYFKKIEVRH